MKHFKTFKEAQTYARELAKELGRSVSMARDDEGWAVDDRLWQPTELPDTPVEDQPEDYRTCLLCGGFGHSPLGGKCANCEGEGVIPGRYEPCSNCSGTGNAPAGIECEDCEGEGEIWVRCY